MDPRRYLNEIVVPTIQDYAKDVRSVRHGFLACVVTFHTLDYLAVGKGKDLLRTRMKKECPSFGTIDQIAHALKHKAAGGNVKVDDLVERRPANWGEGVWGISRWGDGIGGVTLTSNPQIDLLNELNTALSHLGSQLPALEESWLETIRLWANRDARIAKVFVFGSRAKGTHR